MEKRPPIRSTPADVIADRPALTKSLKLAQLKRNRGAFLPPPPPYIEYTRVSAVWGW